MKCAKLSTPEYLSLARSKEQEIKDYLYLEECKMKVKKTIVVKQGDGHFMREIRRMKSEREAKQKEQDRLKKLKKSTSKTDSSNKETTTNEQ